LPKNRTIAQLRRAMSSQLRHVSTIGKKVLSSNLSSRCLHNMVNVGPLAAEIGPVVWGTPANFNGFRVLAALLHKCYIYSSSGRQQNFAALNRGRRLYSAGRPSRWASVHILVLVFFDCLSLSLYFFLFRVVFIIYICSKVSHKIAKHKQ